MRRIFGYPGDGINGVFGALNRAGGKIESIQARHEEMAAFMASAHDKFGELIGFKGLYVDDPETLGEAWDEALRCGRPVVLEVKTDPEVPPLPPHITLDQARNLMSALVKGDRHGGRVIAGAARQILGSILPGSSA